ncbi:hypothetical protein Nazgul05 [Burkholderia phage BcepNazgul]|uniref:Uncharacterized protein n=1 Tax=Burkholderia phage BcepNazgul TaxID=242861 RepID=Q6UYG0_9CAUD|nr:hypothetical protein Nazgul05 [Burkholderia phage BcepNazgul]AAQ63381.2 hypothetical protein Nazgul05 [Burkholderia phage BcepNazgul]
MWRDQQTFRSWGGTARLTYDPKSSPSRPWAIFIDGTAVNRRASLWEATMYVAARHGAVMPVYRFREALIEAARWRSFYLNGVDWSINASLTAAMHDYRSLADLPVRTALAVADAANGGYHIHRACGYSPREAWAIAFRTARIMYEGK